jgi:hypothetical protein
VAVLSEAVDQGFSHGLGVSHFSRSW